MSKLYTSICWATSSKQKVKKAADEKKMLVKMMKEVGFGATCGETPTLSSDGRIINDNVGNIFLLSIQQCMQNSF